MFFCVQLSEKELSVGPLAPGYRMCSELISRSKRLVLRLLKVPSNPASIRLYDSSSWKRREMKLPAAPSALNVYSAA